MSYTSPPPPPPGGSSPYYSSTPPAPPPKPSASSTRARGPPLPPPPPQTEPLELDGGQGGQYHYQQAQQQHTQPPYDGNQPGVGYYAAREQGVPDIPPIDAGWLPEIVQDKTYAISGVRVQQLTKDSTSDLHHLLKTPSLQHALLSSPSTAHPSITASQAPLLPLLRQNAELTSSLSELESNLAQKRAATQSRLLSLRALEQQHASKLTETESALGQFSPMALYQRLNAGVSEQELLVRGMEESWLDEDGVAGDREVESFVRRVKEAAKQSFLRRERRERWDEGRVGGWR